MKQGEEDPFFGEYRDALKLIYKIDERTRIFMDRDYVSKADLSNEAIKNEQKLNLVNQKMDAAITRLEEKLVPIKAITYGIVGIMVTGIIGGLLKLVIK